MITEAAIVDALMAFGTGQVRRARNCAWFAAPQFMVRAEVPVSVDVDVLSEPHVAELAKHYADSRNWAEVVRLVDRPSRLPEVGDEEFCAWYASADREVTKLRSELAVMLVGLEVRRVRSFGVKGTNAESPRTWWPLVGFDGAVPVVMCLPVAT